MPRIPFITGGNPLPNLPGPVLDNQRRPTSNTREQQQAVGRLGASTRAPEVPMSLAENGLGAVGAAISEAGGAAQAIAVAHQRNSDKLGINEKETLLDISRQEFENSMAKEPNPSRWPELFEARVKGLQEKVFAGSEKLSADGQAELASRWNRWLGMTRSQVEGLAISETSRKAASLNEAGIKLGIETQDEERFEAELADGIKNLRINENLAGLYRGQFKEEGRRQKKEAEVERYQQAESEVVTLSRGLGKEKAHAHIETMNEPERVKERLRGLADQSHHEAATTKYGTLRNRILEGDITSELHVEMEALDDPHLDATQQEGLKDIIRKGQQAALVKEREENGHQHYVRLRQDAEDYDPTTDPDRSKFGKIRLEMWEKIQPGLRDNAVAVLDAKASGKVPPAPEWMENLINETVGSAFDPVHGAKWRRKEYRDVWEPDIAPDGQLRLDKEGKPKVKKVHKQVDYDDPVGRARAEADKGRLMREMDKFKKANPNAEPEAIQQQIYKLLPAGTRKQNLEALMGGAKKSAATGTETGIGGTVTSYGYSNDSTPDSNSSAGIGAFVPDAEMAKIKAGQPSDFKLRAGDIAVSQDVEADFRAAGIKPGDQVMVRLANGEAQLVRWMDRTANDTELVKINAAREKKGQKPIKPLRGRFDFYSPSGKSRYDGMKVVGWTKPTSLMAQN